MSDKRKASRVAMGVRVAARESGARALALRSVEPRESRGGSAPVRTTGAVIVHALGNHPGRHLCGGVALDARVQPIPIQTLEPKLRLEAYEAILRELGEMRVALADVAGGSLTIEICHGCEYNAESGKVGTERALAVALAASAAKSKRRSAAAEMVADFESEEDT